jgi:hypothetical protein
MAVAERFVSVFLLVFIILVATVVPEICGQNVKSLYVVPRKENTNIHIFEATETRNLVSDSTGVRKSDSLTGHTLRKRSAESKSNITTSVSFLFLPRMICWYALCDKYMRCRTSLVPKRCVVQYYALKCCRAVWFWNAVGNKIKVSCTRPCCIALMQLYL